MLLYDIVKPIVDGKDGYGIETEVLRDIIARLQAELPENRGKPPMQSRKEIEERLEWWSKRAKWWATQSGEEALLYLAGARSCVTLLHTVLNIPIEEREIH